MKINAFAGIMCFLLFFQLHSIMGAPISLNSPDGKIVVNIEIKEKLEPFPAGSRLYYSISFQGKEILAESPFGLEFKNMSPIAENLVIENEKRETIHENWERAWGKNKKVLNHANELRLYLKESIVPNRKIELLFRAYNDGVAFRYFLPEQPGFQEFRLTSERSYFAFNQNHTVWAANYGGFISHQESEFQQRKLNDIAFKEIMGLPLLVQVDASIWVAITEANLTDWAGMYVAPAASIPQALVTTLSPRLDEPGTLVISKAPRYSPWRVLMIGQKPGDLIESNLIANLNEPRALNDITWIKPGKSAWDRWWCGSYIPDATFEVGANTATFKYFTDFAAEMGWEYVLVDWYWYGPPFDPNLPFAEGPNQAVDITKPSPQVDIQEIIRNAKSKKVGVLLWLDWFHADKQMNEAFPLYEKWGVAGVKIDFMQRDDQEMVNFYHQVVKKAAEHHLVVDFHGAYKPTGWSRTYPNLMTREGVMGNEYTKWSDRITPDHVLTLPFTRMLCGEMDFTPGGFRHKTKETFKIVGGDAPGPFVMGTRCYQLALMVVFESALQVLCDSPFNYRGQAGLDFLKIVPTTWDETKVIHGQVGDFITIARRSGKDWFIGSMTDWDARSLEIPLNFLEKGKYEAQIYSDALDADEYPDRLRFEKKIVTSTDKIIAKMAPGGGQVVYLKRIF
ncbi:glycoside hydrolase family 97 protein [candidate division KSB1 bacterium]|nr:glycoside hydrolase family 97 protein [candidate division KSB1 bacterium]